MEKKEEADAKRPGVEDESHDGAIDPLGEALFQKQFDGFERRNTFKRHQVFEDKEDYARGVDALNLLQQVQAVDAQVDKGGKADSDEYAFERKRTRTKVNVSGDALETGSLLEDNLNHLAEI